MTVPVEVKPSETKALAMELAASHRRMVESFRAELGLSSEEAVNQLAESDATLDKRVLDGEPDQVTWYDLHALTTRDPESGIKRWEEIKETALSELQSGQRAAKTMEGSSISPWARAQFLAMREEFADGWEPRTGIERTLIDAMAQAHTGFLHWMERLTLLTAMEPGVNDNQSIRANRTWHPPRVSDSDAVEQAAAMVDRFNRLFVRSLRALRDLRRYSTTVIVQQADQVNVAEHQLNVGTGGCQP